MTDGQVLGLIYLGLASIYGAIHFAVYRFRR